MYPLPSYNRVNLVVDFDDSKIIATDIFLFSIVG